METENEKDKNHETSNTEEEDRSMKVSFPMDIKKNIFSNNKIKNTKKPPAPLNMICGVCSAPAPNYLHFGGKV